MAEVNTEVLDESVSTENSESGAGSVSSVSVIVFACRH